MAAYPSGNILILSDRASNVARVLRIIKRIDQQGDNEVDIVPLQHATAAEVVRVVNTFFTQQGGGGEAGGGSPARVIAGTSGWIWRVREGKVVHGRVYPSAPAAIDAFENGGR